jgi:protein-tyrosine phosphatase
MKILFVCLGNICRSPLAEAIAKDFCAKNNIDIVIDSAGTGNWHIGEPPCENSIKIAKQNGIDISGMRARQIVVHDFKNFDIIVGLDSSNIENLKRMGCVNPMLLGDFGFDGKDVPDPYFFSGFEGFEKVYHMIEKCVQNLLDNINTNNYQQQ